MKLYIILFFLITLMSCSNQSVDKQSSGGITLKQGNDSVPHSDSGQITKIDKPAGSISDRLLRLAQIIDSAGYSFDSTREYVTIRNKKNEPETIRKIVKGNYVFYDVPYQRTLLYINMNDSNYLKYGFVKEMNLNLKKFDCVQKIKAFFFIKRKGSITPEKQSYYPDGVVEEWEFPDTISAIQASEEFGVKQGKFFMNCGAFVCYKDNYMYVFRTRASGFMYSIKPFFKQFIIDNAASITSKDTWKYY